MIDLALLRGERFQEIADLIKKKEPDFDVQALADLDKKVRSLKIEVEELRHEKKSLAKQASGGISDDLRAKSVELGKSLKAKETELEELDAKFKKLYVACPNAALPEVPAGNKEANKKVREWGQKTEFAFEPKNHVELNENLKWFDFKAAARISGSNQVFYQGDGLKMLYALTRMMISHNAKNGHQPVLPPYLVNEKTMVANGNLPKFEGDFYSVQDGLSLLPTAEVTFSGLFGGQILKHDQLPIRNSAWTSCFRREAGGYGSTERGLIRIHQFEKVEIYSVCEPDKSEAELERMIGIAESFVQKLGLHYKVSLLAGQDTSFQSAKTFDIEVWLPGQKAYYEVSSASNCRSFQARRAGIRYKDENGKNQLVHTLNASSLALPRLMVAIIESCQQADGSLKLPEILQKEMDKVW